MPRPIGTTFADLLGKLTDAHVASALLNEVLKRIPTEAPAFRALDAQHVELADQTAEDDRAVAASACFP